jgi:ribonuclease-3
MNTFEKLVQNAADIEKNLGYCFKDRALLALAFVHRSFINETRDLIHHNERLEFLGDSVLGMIVSDYLYRSLPNRPEGELSYLRSRLVEAESCASFVKKLHVEPFLLLGKGERMGDRRGRDTILADLFEALVGAIFLDGGFIAAQHFLFSHFTHEIEEILRTPLENWKALLQDYCQKKFQRPPKYEVLSETGPDHSKIFVISVSVEGIVLGQGEGGSKKIAQQAAAQNAMAQLK